MYKQKHITVICLAQNWVTRSALKAPQKISSIKVYRQWFCSIKINRSDYWKLLKFRTFKPKVLSQLTTNVKGEISWFCFCMPYYFYAGNRHLQKAHFEGVSTCLCMEIWEGAHQGRDETWCSLVPYKKIIFFKIFFFWRRALSVIIKFLCLLSPL